MVYGSDYVDAVNQFRDDWSVIEKTFADNPSDFDLEAINADYFDLTIVKHDGEWVYDPEACSADKLNELFEKHMIVKL